MDRPPSSHPPPPAWGPHVGWAPPPPPKTFKERFFSDWRYPVATFKAILILGFLGFYVLAGHEAWFHNPTDVDAVVVVDGKRIEVPARAWAKQRLAMDPHEVDITFDDGRHEHMTVDLSTGRCFREFRAYSLTKEACYAMVSVTGLYEDGDGAARVVHTYRQRQDLEHGVHCPDPDLVERYGRKLRTKYLRPNKPLQKKIYGRKGQLILKVIDCEVLDDPERLASWLEGV